MLFIVRVLNSHTKNIGVIMGDRRTFGTYIKTCHIIRSYHSFSLLYPALFSKFRKNDIFQTKNDSLLDADCT